MENKEEVEVKEDAKEEKKEELPTGDTGEGSKPETTPILDKAIAENERMEANLKREEELLSRREKLMAGEVLGGKSEIRGVEVKEEDPVSYAKKVAAGEVDPFGIDEPKKE